MWKLQNFSVTQILREINFGDSTSAKSATLKNLDALDYEFWHLLKAKIHQINKIQSPRRAKIALADSPQLI